MKQKKLLLLIMFLSFSIGCNKEVNSPNNDELVYGSTDTAYVPLKIGNEWTYRISNYNLDGELVLEHNLYIKVIGDTTIDGQSWFIITHYGGTDTVITFEQNYLGTLYYWDIHSNTPQITLKYPPIPSGSYIVEFLVYLNGQDTIITYPMNVSTSTSVVSVLGGKFNCFKYSHEEYSFHWPSTSIGIQAEDMFYSSMGLVKSIGYREKTPYLERIDYIYELLHFSIK